jgi:hypothetical protein
MFITFILSTGCGFSLPLFVQFNRISTKIFYDQLYITFSVTVSEPLTLKAPLAMNDLAKLNGVVNTETTSWP